MRVLRGPNLFACRPVLQIIRDIGPYEEMPSSSFPGLVERLTAWLLGLHKYECGIERPGGFVERLQRGTYLGYIVEHITLKLQTLIGFNVSFGRARGIYNVVIAYREEEPARAALKQHCG